MNFGESTDVQHVRAIHRLLDLSPVFGGKIGIYNAQFGGINPKLHAGVLGIIHLAACDGCADFVVMGKEREQAGFVNANGQDRIPDVDGPLGGQSDWQ